MKSCLLACVAVVAAARALATESHARVASRLEVQLAHARRWRDESLACFQSRNGLSLPPADAR